MTDRKKCLSEVILNIAKTRNSQRFAQYQKEAVELISIQSGGGILKVITLYCVIESTCHLMWSDTVNMVVPSTSCEQSNRYNSGLKMLFVFQF